MAKTIILFIYMKFKKVQTKNMNKSFERKKIRTKPERKCKKQRKWREN
jgi:hypothetical protein